jgi:hypothetical protein
MTPLAWVGLIIIVVIIMFIKLTPDDLDNDSPYDTENEAGPLLTESAV